MLLISCQLPTIVPVTYLHKIYLNTCDIYIYIWYPPPPKTYIFSFCTGIYSVLCIFEDLFFLRHFFADFGGGVYKRL